MSVFAKPVDKPFITTKEDIEKLTQSYDPKVMERVLKNHSRLEKQIVKKETKSCTGRK